VRKVLLVEFVVFLTLPAAHASAQSFHAIEIGVLPGETSSFATDVNNARQVVGFSGSRAFLWDPVNGMRDLGIETNRLRINNSGIVAGIRSVGSHSRPFLWADGQVFDLPNAPPEDVFFLLEWTDNDILVVCGQRCWGLYQGALYDLEALTGASIAAVNDQARIGGTLAGDAYLRLPDGRVLTPWRAAVFPPETPGPGAVEVIGPAGHFAGRSGSQIMYGTPNEAVFPLAVRVPARGGIGLNDMNRAGDLVGVYRISNLLSELDTGFLFSNATGALINLRDAIVSGPSTIRNAVAVTDSGDVAANAIVDSAFRVVLLVRAVPPAPANLTFSVDGAIVSLAWSQTPGAVDYVIEAGSTPGASDLYNAPAGSQTTFATLAPPGRYHVRVRARNASGVSAPSNEVIVVVP
jgi:probable HAF family extracellular repeat protein